MLCHVSALLMFSNMEQPMTGNPEKPSWNQRLRDEGERLYAKANRLMGRNVQPPMPLFDNNREGR